MSVTHRTLEIDGVPCDQLTAGELSLTVARTGAEPVSLRRGGAGYLHRDGLLTKPAAGWANHATVMGYFLHRLWQEESTYRGSIIRGGNHGFLRHFAFAAPVFDAANGSLIYEVRPEQIPADAYPLRVGLKLTYQLTGEAWITQFHFTNEEPELDAHVSFGLHPGFAVTSWQSARVEFPAGTYLRHWAPGNFLDGRVEPIVHAGGEMPFDKALLPGSFLLELSQVPERTFRLTDPVSGRRVVLDFAEVPYVTVWSEGDDFICIEPCWGLPDSNPPVPFEEKVGIQVIPAGGELIRAFVIQPDTIERG